MLNDTTPGLGANAVLPLMECFYTLQGEGHHAGRAAYFIRLGGCDVGCHWCDVKESWEAGKHPLTKVSHIAAKVLEQAGIAVITGGEPLMWNMDELTTQLRAKGLKTHLETSGAYPLTGLWDWICLSPKKNKLPLEEIYAKANELKVVIYNRHDFTFAEMEAKKVGRDCLLYLQPEWGRRKQVTPDVTNYIMEHPQWRISLQTHKYLGIP